jgi:hypothetical protein
MSILDMNTENRGPIQEGEVTEFWKLNDQRFINNER